MYTIHNEADEVIGSYKVYAFAQRAAAKAWRKDGLYRCVKQNGVVVADPKQW